MLVLGRVPGGGRGCPGWEAESGSNQPLRSLTGLQTDIIMISALVLVFIILNFWICYNSQLLP